MLCGMRSYAWRTDNGNDNWRRRLEHLVGDGREELSLLSIKTSFRLSRETQEVLVRQYWL